MTGEEKAGITFPTGRCTRLIRSKVSTDRVSQKAGVALASALEYLTAEIIEAAGDIAKEDGFKRIKPRHIKLAVNTDELLQDMWKGSDLAQGGVVPHSEEMIREGIKQKKGKRKAKKAV